MDHHYIVRFKKESLVRVKNEAGDFIDVPSALLAISNVSSSSKKRSAYERYQESKNSVPKENRGYTKKFHAATIAKHEFPYVQAFATYEEAKEFALTKAQTLDHSGKFALPIFQATGVFRDSFDIQYSDIDEYFVLPENGKIPHIVECASLSHADPAPSDAFVFVDIRGLNFRHAEIAKIHSADSENITNHGQHLSNEEIQRIVFSDRERQRRNFAYKPYDEKAKLKAELKTLKEKSEADKVVRKAKQELVLTSFWRILAILIALLAIRARTTLFSKVVMLLNIAIISSGFISAALVVLRHRFWPFKTKAEIDYLAQNEEIDTFRAELRAEKKAFKRAMESEEDCAQYKAYSETFKTFLTTLDKFFKHRIKSDFETEEKIFPSYKAIHATKTELKMWREFQRKCGTRQEKLSFMKSIVENRNHRMSSSFV